MISDAFLEIKYRRNFFEEVQSQTRPELKPLIFVAHPWMAMAALMIGAFVGMLSEASLNIALPQLMSAFHVGSGTI